MTFLSDFDAREITKAAVSGSAKRTKREHIKKGYQWQLSLYGVLSTLNAVESSYCRVEVLSNTPWNYRIVSLIYDLFRELKPVAPYSIWIYDKARDAVKQVGRYL